MLLRRGFVVLLVFVVGASQAKSLGLTFDDGLNPDAVPRARQWNDEILASLRDADAPAMVFPSLRKIGDGDGFALISEWSAAGHPVGNHTSRHRSLSSARVSLSDFIQDVEEADEAFRTLPTFRRRLRFPFLKEGDTLEKRDGFRRWMEDHRYLPAPVSIDTSDWYYDQVFLALSSRGDAARARRLQTEYVAHLLARAEYYDGLAIRALGRSPAHVLLLHVNAINAATLATTIRQFRRRGWTFVAPERAFEDPLYSSSPDVLPAGESIVWSWAKAAGIEDLRYPGEDAAYEEPRLRSLDLLPARSSADAP